MPQIRVPSQRVAAEKLQELTAKLFRTSGLRDDDAGLVADSLIQASLRGIDSHGVARLPHYLRRIEAGSIRARPTTTCETRGQSAAVVDGDHGLGQLVMARATDEAIALATETGAGWVAVRHSSHCGALAYYGLRAADANMIGLIFTHVDPMVVPYGAREPFCGTNPVCITAPGPNDQTLCLDMATSITPWNSIMNAVTDQAEIPLGWGVDAAGQDTTDASKVTAVYPFGGYKGSGLGLLIDVLCAMLGGAPIGPDIPAMYGDLTQRRMLGGLVGVIDIGRFVNPTLFRQRIGDLVQRWTTLPTVEGQDQVLFPGQPEIETCKRRLREGIPVSPGVLEELKQSAQQLGIAWPDLAMRPAK
ncbi:MAG: Ldh family oxidoreductase [Planctomycetes bacterium]|nr:Ldh family oxidoreductase [Planctomycetota bacterium]